MNQDAILKASVTICTCRASMCVHCWLSGSFCSKNGPYKPLAMAYAMPYLLPGSVTDTSSGFCLFVTDKMRAQ
jgi:hypothetical protein